jgi:hypothetical protein
LLLLLLLLLPLPHLCRVGRPHRRGRARPPHIHLAVIIVMAAVVVAATAAAITAAAVVPVCTTAHVIEATPVLRRTKHLALLDRTPLLETARGR